MMGYRLVECKSHLDSKKPKKPTRKNRITIDKLTENERKILIDSLVDPIFVISNANSSLKGKLEKYVDQETRENFYMIERSQKKLLDSINQLRTSWNSSR